MPTSPTPDPLPDPSSSDVKALVLLALVVVLGCLALNRLVVGGIPHGWDAASYHFQARVFASGRLTAPSTQLIDMFWMANTINRIDKRFTQYPPGWPAVLAVALKVGAPALANALLTAGCVVYVWFSTYWIFGRGEAWASAILALLSPFLLFMGSDYLAHAMTACMLSGSLCFALCACRAGGWRAAAWGAAAGACAALAVHTRPYTALLGLVGTALILIVFARVTLSFRHLLLAGIGAFPLLIAGAAAFLWYNFATTGSAFKTGYQHYDANLTFLGGGDWKRDSLWQNIRTNIPLAVNGLHAHVWRWPGTDFLLVPAALLFARGQRRLIAALLAALLFYVLAHSLYFYFDHYYGPRLIFESVPWLFMISGVGAAALYRHFWHCSTASRINLGVFAFILVGFTVYFFVDRARYYSQNYCGQSSEALRRSRVHELDNALVFIRTNEPAAYATFAHLNDVVLHRSPVVFARYVEDRVPLAMAEFPREQTLILDIEYDLIPGPDGYADRFRLKRLEWHRVR